LFEYLGGGNGTPPVFKYYSNTAPSSGEIIAGIITPLLVNNTQDKYFNDFIGRFTSYTPNKKDRAAIIISFVQHIPYDQVKSSKISSNITAGIYYPYETIYLDKGVCSDKSILMAYLLDKLGYDVVLFAWDQPQPGHMAVGIKCDRPYDFAGSGYAFIESTSPSIPTYVPGESVGGFTITPDPAIIHVPSLTGSYSTGKLDLSQEYQDSQEYTALEKRGGATGHALNRPDYNRWVALTEKYDLQYKT
jgi:hypothetical protein